MYKLPLLLFLFVGLFACESQQKEDPQPVITDRIVLKEPQIVGDSAAVLTWSLLNNPDFVEYRLLRQEDKAESYAVFTNFSIRNREDSTYFDQYMPYTDQVQYQVIGTLSSGKTIESNVVTFQRPDVHVVQAFPFDVQYDSQTRELFFFGKKGTIQQYDVTRHQLTKTIQVGMPIGYCSLGSYQGRKELYVPCDDGRVFIYSAATLDKLDELAVYPFSTTDALTSIIASNEQLFVATTKNGGPSLRVYDRATKAQLASASYSVSSDRMLKKVPNTATDLIGITLSTWPTDQTTYRFSATGSSLSEGDDQYHGHHPLEGRLFEFAPAGDRYVTGREGGVYRTNMTYVTSLPRRGRMDFTCYGFDPTAQTLYAGTTTKTIEVFSLNDYTPVRSLKTRLFPYKLFNDGPRGFVSVSIQNPVENYVYSSSYPSAKMLVEQLAY